MTEVLPNGNGTIGWVERYSNLLIIILELIEDL